jgi:hypothetical protein
MNTPTPPSASTLLVYEPLGHAIDHQDALAQRPATLNGAVIGLLNNTKDLVDSLLEEVKTLILQDFPQAQFRFFRKQSVSGASALMLEELAQCQAVVTAVGD